MAAAKKHRHQTGIHPDLLLRTVALLPRFAAAIHDWHRRQVAEGFTVNQALVVHHLVGHGDASPSGLADWMQVTRGSVTPTIKRLEELGLLVRRTDEHDARRQWLSATRKARAIAASVEKKALRPALWAFADWPAQELESFVGGMERVLKNKVFGGGE